jgi:HK97 family phage major capsid protein
MNSVDLIEKKELLKNEMREITSLCRKEIRMMNEEENTLFNQKKSEIQNINEELRKLSEETEIQNDITKQTKTMEKKNFSLVKAIRSVANNQPLDEFNQTIVNAGMDEMRATGNSFQGQLVLPTEQRAVDVATEGVDVVATDIWNVMEAIHNKSVMAQLGCNIITNLVNDVQIPVISTINCSWEGETATHSDDTATFSSVKLSPKRLSCVVPISKMLLQQDSTGVESAIRNEITKAIMGKLEATIFGSAAGTTTQPEGIFYNGGSALTTVATFADICSLEANLDGVENYGEKKYVMGTSAKATLRGTQKANGTGFIYENGEIDGTSAVATGFVGANNIAYGDWSNLVIGLWSGLDIVVDNFTLASSGCVRLIVNFYADAKLARTGSIALATV